MSQDWCCIGWCGFLCLMCTPRERKRGKKHISTNSDLVPLLASHLDLSSTCKYICLPELVWQTVLITAQWYTDLLNTKCKTAYWQNIWIIHTTCLCVVWRESQQLTVLEFFCPLLSGYISTWLFTWLEERLKVAYFCPILAAAIQIPKPDLSPTFNWSKMQPQDI